MTRQVLDLPGMKLGHASDSWAPLTPGRDDLFRTFWRSKGVVLAATALGVIAGLAWCLPQPMIYRAHAALEVLDQDRDFHGSSGITATRSGGPVASRAGLATHARILASRSLARKTLLKLREGGADRPARADDGRLTESLRVTTPGETFILELEADSAYPERAAAFLNALADVYIEENRQARWSAVRETEVWLERQLSDLRMKLEASQEKLQSYARESGLVFVNPDETVAVQRLRQLQAELSQAEADRISKESSFEEVKSGSDAPLPESQQVLNLRAYEQDLTKLRKELADLDAMFTPEHPRVKRVAAQITEMENAIARERVVLLEQASGDYRAALRRQDLLAANYERQARLVSDHAVRSIHYDILRREVDTNQEMYDSLLRRVKETAVAAALNAGNVRILDQAQTPSVPIGPSRTAHGVMGGMLGCFAGLLLVLIRARFDSRLHSPGDVAQWMRSPELGTIPAASAHLFQGDSGRDRSRWLRVRYSGQRDGSLALRRQRGNPLHPSVRFPIERLAEASDFCPMAEGVRAALTSVLLGANGGRAHTVLAVTSPSPKDGKTTITCNLAIALARIGRKTLLVDADFRRPRLHEVFGVSNDVGLTSLLCGGEGDRVSGLHRAVQPTSIDGLFVLPNGPADAASAHTIYSRRLAFLLDVLRQQYPVVLIDTPPMMQIADARVLAQLSDAAVLVVRAGRTTRFAARNAEERLTQDGTRVLGVLLNGWAPDDGVESYYSYPPQSSNGESRSMAAAAS